MTTNIHPPASTLPATFSGSEAQALEALRVRFGEDHDTLGERERARLLFLRWLVRNGRLAR
jgi:hypothetical protein